MYFVNREEIDNLLIYVEELIPELQQAGMETTTERLALERATHMSVEVMIDVGNKMIDGFIMRDPGSYHDIIDILMDEKVLPYEEENQYKRIIDMRKAVVREYTTVSHERLLSEWNECLGSLRQFPERIRHYLNAELGSVSAFTKE
ncbi:MULTISPECIES: DUF86 domain-containing protein [Salimicrobium]|uniref:DUF86 domain-containing protein n=3 Tax=Salimicrobium TaxID=351195 RepID=K2GRL2_9BACI|nr:MULTISPECIES: DUF86 domain-containing protein [Salimicrobium]AKG03998.1 hypothetical protein AAV35_003800 [Salimicrobium jeotgali]EKE33039.1 hypothetical protein MJ3_01025 [Salimicrobium jeotgali]MBM7694967.1 uncharacterized protein YutE (UPF0331/DUF86 family) [Salimicrobium jeotgali]SDY01313.1 Uncharacterized conserved protein YutE, UPF0331/DUF86 family [Salimicrobium album]SIS71942.1 Uncharacterized conserved protein YutE, UPF0331/DUF86 family [Salimicrobium salexigens]